MSDIKDLLTYLESISISLERIADVLEDVEEVRGGQAVLQTLDIATLED